MNIIQDLIPRGRRNRPGTKIIAKHITIHNTGNVSRGAGAKAHAKYIKGEHAAARPASWHFTTDDTYIFQHLNLDEMGYHAGSNANRNSIGIEICQNIDNNYMEGQRKAARLCAYLIDSGMFGHNRVEEIILLKQHWDWTGKNCPSVIRAKKAGWSEFIKSVETFMVKPEVKEPEVKEPDIELPTEQIELPPGFEAPDIDRSEIGDNPEDWIDPIIIPRKPLPIFDRYGPNVIERFKGLIDELRNKLPERKVIDHRDLLRRINI